MMEIRFGEFASELELPGAIQADAIQANYADGFLWVILPKAKPRHIPIEEKQDD
jgi:HSP20 family molecular chaperone IbpA